MPALVEQQTQVGVKNILFTTDFSALAEKAMPYASAIARHYAAMPHGYASATPFPPYRLWLSPPKRFRSNPTAPAMRRSVRWKNFSELLR